MMYTTVYDSPLGTLRLLGAKDGLAALWFDAAENSPFHAERPEVRDDWPLFGRVRAWLDAYFARQNPAPGTIPLQLTGSPFQREVWDILKTIPYGRTTTYGEIAATVARRRGMPRMSAQAVGGAVGRNPVSILIPCHRVVGTGGSLTGFGGGLANKARLLELEGVDMRTLFLPGQHR